MLQDQFDEIKAYLSRNKMTVDDSSSPAPAALELQSDLVSRISALQDLVTKQNFQLEELHKDRQLLLEDNKIMKDHIKSLSVDLSALRDQTNSAGAPSPHGCSHSSSANHYPRSSRGAGVGRSSSVSDENCELIIQGVLKRDAVTSEEELHGIAFAVLNTVLPSFQRENVAGVRVFTPRGAPRDGEELTEGSLGSTSVGVTSSCVVQLSRAELVKDVMRAKRALANNYLNTKDINPELLGQSSSVCMPAHKIFINESLPHDKFQLFKNLKPIAQGLGFKYVWHAGGRFLARHKGGERAHVFASAADLQAIRTACRSVPSKRQSTTHATDNNIDFMAHGSPGIGPTNNNSVASS